MQNADALSAIADVVASNKEQATPSIFDGNIVDANKIQATRQVSDKLRGGMNNTNAALGLLGAGTPYGN